MKKIYITFLVTFICTNLYAAGDATKPLKVDWSFNGFFGTFDRAQLQRGFQVYKMNSISSPDISDSGMLATPPLYGSGSVA